MPVTVDTLDDDNASGLTLREAIALIISGTTGPIEFDNILSGGLISLTNGSLNISADMTFQGDIGSDGTFDISLTNANGGDLISLATDGVHFTNAGAILTIDNTTASGFDFDVFDVRGEDVTISNAGNILADGPVLGYVRATGISIYGDNFTLNNAANATISSAGRYGVRVDPSSNAVNTIINNDGLIEGTDDAIVMLQGSIVNNGTIRTTGTFDGGGSQTPGYFSDGISVQGTLPVGMSVPADGLVSVYNNAGASIEGLRAGMILSGGGYVDNRGTISAEVIGVLAQYTPSDTDYTFLFANFGGTVERTSTEEYGISEGLAGAITIFGGQEFTRATIGNTLSSSQILSTDIAINAYIGTSLTNQFGAIITGDTDNTGDDGVSFYGVEQSYFQTTALINENGYLDVNSDFVSAQGITVNANGELVTSSGTYALQGGNAGFALLPLLYLANITAPPVLPLVDLAASDNAGYIVFQTDGSGVLFPAAVDIMTANDGTLTVNYLGGGEYDVVDSGGDPYFAVDAANDYDDSIVNLGSEMNGDIITGLGNDFLANAFSVINGDVMTGVGDDTVSNTNNFSAVLGVINGDVMTGDGDDTVTNDGTINGSVMMGDGNDVYTGSGSVTGGNHPAGGNGLAQGNPNGYVIDGGAGNDEITAGSGDNTLIGGSGDDILNGGGGADVLNGGEGDDIASYAGAASGVSVNLLTGAGTAGDAAGDSFSGIEGLIGTGFDDTLTGDTGNNAFEGGDGADVLDGGGGTDSASYVSSDGGVTVSLFTGRGFGYHAAGDTLSNIEALIGSSYNDILVGRDGASDTLRGGDGNDSLRANGADDFVYGEGGNDLIFAGFGSDTIDGGAGIDTLMLTNALAGSIIRLDLGTGSLNVAAGDTYTNVENVAGSAFRDLLYGDNGNNFLDGRGGNDLLIGNGGADVLDGGAGFDTASYANSATSVSVSLFLGSGPGNDIIRNVEHLVGSNFNDLLVGNDGVDETLDGGSGADSLRGNGGNDILNGGGGNDILFSGFGNDTHDGGDGFDTITYAQASAGVIVRLDLGTGSLGHAAGDTYANIENITGSSAFRDLLYGNDIGNVIDGRGGNDLLIGNGGSDTLIGGNGFDKLDGGTGFDVLTGGAGDDIFVFEAGYQADRITDFTFDEDQVDLTSFGFTAYSQVSSLMYTDGADTVITFGGGDALRLVGISLGNLTASDFIMLTSPGNAPASTAAAPANDSFDFGDEIGTQDPSTAFMQQELMAEWDASQAMNVPIYQANEYGVLEIFTEDDPGYDVWDAVI